MSNYIDFQSNTMAYPHQIKGTDLYYFQEYFGVNKNGYDKYIDYLQAQINKNYGIEETSKSTPSKTRVLRENAWAIYKKDKSLEYEDFVKQIKDGKISKVANSFITPINQNPFELDVNGNLLLKSLGSDLENTSFECGDILIDKEGNLLRNTKGSMVIRKPNKFGFYPVDVFKSAVNKETGEREVSAIEFNFLDQKGTLISKTHFNRPNNGELIPVVRNYFNQNGGKQFRSRQIYPQGYIACTSNGMEYLPSAGAVLMENRDRKLKNAQPLVADEAPFVKELQDRLESLEEILKNIGTIYDNGGYSKELYNDILNIINQEYDISDNLNGR